MRLLLFATLLLCVGCPAPLHALSIEVRSGGRPVASAVVALVCRPGGGAHLSDERGLVLLKISEGQQMDRCRLVAGKAGFLTMELQPVRACARQEPCPAVVLELMELTEAPGASSSPSSSSSEVAP
jgi:hypothetical protein